MARKLTIWMRDNSAFVSKASIVGAAGLGFTMIQIDEYLGASVCWLALAIIIGFRARGEPTRIRKTAWVLGAILVGTLLLYWTTIKRGDNAWSAFSGPGPIPAPSIAIRAGVGSAIIYDGSGPLSLFMVGYQSKYGQTISPVIYLAYIRVANMQSVASTVEAYSVAVSNTQNGPWDELVPIPLATCSLYALGVRSQGPLTVLFPRGAYRLGTEMKQEDLLYSALLNPQPTLETALRQQILAHQTVSGWSAFDARKRGNVIRNYFRIAIRDTAGVLSISVSALPRRGNREPEVEPQPGSIDRVGAIVNLSRSRIKYYGDPYPKP